MRNSSLSLKRRQYQRSIISLLNIEDAITRVQELMGYKPYNGIVGHIDSKWRNRSARVADRSRWKSTHLRCCQANASDRSLAIVRPGADGSGRTRRGVTARAVSR